MKKPLVSLLALLVTSPAFAAFLGVSLEPLFLYQDFYHHCETSIPNAIEIIGSIEGGKAVEAHFHDPAWDNDRYGRNPNYAFLPEELTGMEVGLDSLGDYYIAKLPMSPRLLVWAFKHLDGYIDACRPTKPIATLSPYGHVYTFTPKDASTFYTGPARFRGTLSDGSPFGIRLLFLQRHASLVP
jgi:hypothetical protein